MKKLHKSSYKAPLFPVSPKLLIAFFLIVAITMVMDPLVSKIKKQANNFHGNGLESDEYVNFIRSQTGKFDTNAKVAYFLNKRVAAPEGPDYEDTKVLGQQAPDDNKWIEVNLTEQRLYTHDGGAVTGNYLVSTGKWGLTPTGTYRTYVKYRYTTMSGGSGASYYYLPNVPYTMYFYKGYGIHGTYWHNNFGHPMSHGCINMKTEEAGIVYNWAPVGTKVVIHY